MWSPAKGWGKIKKYVGGGIKNKQSSVRKKKQEKYEGGVGGIKYFAAGEKNKSRAKHTPL